MAGIVDSLTKNLLEFFDCLRMAGVRVSISEILDVFIALTYIDVMNKEMVRVTVSSFVAKSEEEKKIFNEAFYRFFIPAEIKKQQGNEINRQMKQEKEEILREVSELKFKDQPIEIKEENKQIYSSLSKADKESILEFLKKTSTGKNVKTDFLPIVEQMINSKLISLQQKSNAGPVKSRNVFSAIPSEAGLLAQQVNEKLKEENNLLYKSISDIKEDQIPRVLQLIKDFIKKYRKISRKFRKTNKKKRLDLKSTIRSNQKTGGIQFNLEYKTKPRKKVKYLMLCDVSASMIKFSSFVFQFIMGMSSGNSLVDTYIFSEGVANIKVNAFLSGSTFEKQVKESPIWNKGTNLYTSLKDLEGLNKKIFSPATILIIVSDAKTVDGGPAIEKLQSLKAKMKSILWFNPIPESEWGGIKDMEGFKKYCKVFDCSTLDKLQKTLTNITR